MIKTSDAIEVARSLLGTPYSTLDCINFIKAIIRKAPGGDPKYTDAHVPALWASYNSSPKYRHLIWRQESLDNPRPGMLAFKGKPLGRDHEPSHIGLVTSPTTVIHSSSAKGGVVETDLLNGQWTLLGQSAFIEIGESEGAPVADNVPYYAVVTTESGDLNLRQGPSTNDLKIGSIPKGTTVQVMKDYSSGWSFVKSDYGTGYVAKKYLTITNESPVEDAEEHAGIESTGWFEDMTLISETGAAITLSGRWRIAED